MKRANSEGNANMNYKLLTPGPLTTSKKVKEVMLFDHCTWDEEYKQITQSIRRDLLTLAHAEEPDYTVVLMQGSGTFGVESVFTSVIGNEDKVLILSNGAYGERMVDIAKHANIRHHIYHQSYDQIPNVNAVEDILKQDDSITHIAMVHCETTTGILNDITSISYLAKKYHKVMIVDAMSSFGGVDIDVAQLQIDFIISSANKCIQGVPGFAFVIAKKQALLNAAGKARSLSLDLYEQWVCMQNDGKWRFTSPTHAVLAFAQALRELKEEGGVIARAKRYAHNHALLLDRMQSLGIHPYLKKHQGPIITTFYYPKDAIFSFPTFYAYIKERGYAIYPGKLTDAETFRIGNIGEIYEEDIINVYRIIKQFLKECELCD